MTEIEMNAADRTFLAWLHVEINTGRSTIEVPASLLEHATREGLVEARRLARLAGSELVVRE